MCQECEANVSRDGIAVRILTTAILYAFKDAVKPALVGSEKEKWADCKN